MPSPDTTLTNAQARLTTDKGLGHLDFPAERILYTRDEKGKVTGFSCKQFNPLPQQVLVLDKPQTQADYKFEIERQYRVLFAGLISYKYTGTSCLLKAAVSLHQLLMLVIQIPDPAKISSISGSLLDIYDEIERRTRQPYQWQISFNDKDLFRPLPKTICQEFPLSQYGLWKQIRQKKWQTPAAAIRRKPFTEDGPIPVMEKEQAPVDKQALDNALEAAANTIKINGELAMIPPDGTPEVSRYRANLAKLTLDDVYKQTKFRNRTGDWKLSELVEVIYYVSSMTLVLDKDGEPFGQTGYMNQFPYGMILVSRKFDTYKFAPPPGRYLSLGALAGQQFEINGGVVKKLSIQYHGILGYQEVYATGQWAPDYQEKANEVFGKNKVYVGSVVVMSAFGSKDVGLLDVAGALPDVVEYTIPFFLEAIKKRALEWWDNAGDLLKEIVLDVLKNIIVATLKNIAVKYIVKKIGKKVIPVVNAIAAVKDAIDTIRADEDPSDMIAINCVRLHLKAINQDDKTLGSKILANIMTDKFETELKQAITKHATQQGIKMVDKVKGKVAKRKGTPVDHDKPVDEPKPDAKPTEKTDAKTEPSTDKPKTPKAKEPSKNTGDLSPKEMDEGMKAMKDWDEKEKQKKDKDIQPTDTDAKKKEKDKERATDKKDNKRPDTGQPDKDQTQTSATADAKKKKAKEARLARIKQAAEDKAKKPPPPPDQVADEVEKQGKKTRRNSMAKRSRKAAVKDALEDLRSGIKSERTKYLEERIGYLHGADAVEEFKRTGKLPRGFEYSHFFSVSEYPEFGDRGDVGVLTDKDDHRYGHHKGNTRPPLHGSPRGKWEQDDDEDDEENDNNYVKVFNSY